MRAHTKLFLGALAASAATASATPAMAQAYPQSHERWDDRGDRRYEDRGDRRYDRGYDDRGQTHALRKQIEQLEERARKLDRRDRISEREAYALRRGVAEVKMQLRAYSRDGLSPREAQVIQRRIQELRYRLGYERQDRDGRRW